MKVIIRNACQSNSKADRKEGEISPARCNFVHEIVPKNHTRHRLRGFDGFSKGSIDKTEGNICEYETKSVGHSDMKNMMPKLG